MEKKSKWSEEDLSILRNNYLTKNNTELAKMLNRTYSAVQMKLSKMGWKRPEKYNYNKRFFNKIDTSKKAYWLGFFYADGYVSHSERNWECGIELQKSDANHLKKLNKDLNGNVEVQYRKRENNFSGAETACIRFYSKDMFNDLSTNGCIENKTNKIKLPKLNDELMWHFIRGFFDGDGCILLNKKRECHQIDLCSSSYEFLIQIRQFLYSQNINSYICEMKHNKDDMVHRTMPNYKLFIKGMKNAYNFGVKLYKNADTFLDRKKYKFYNIVEKYNIVERINK